MPVGEDLVAANFIVHVVFCDHAARDLKDWSSKFVGLHPFLDYLTKRSAPP